MPLTHKRLLAFAKRLQAVEDFSSMVRILVEEIEATIGYRRAWVAVFDLDTRMVRILSVEGEGAEDAWARAPVFPLDGDPYMLRILESAEPQIVVDAQTDPDVNREIVEALGNRTIVNVPLRLIDQPVGALGTGSFGDEGVRVPTQEELAYLLELASQLVAASSRLTWARHRAELEDKKRELDRILEQRQRLESLGELAGGVAHDFNNLLTVILASATMLRESDDEEERLAEVTNIEEAAQRASALTTRLLALGRRQALRLAPVDPNDVLKSVVSMLRRVVPATITIDLSRAPALPALMADRGQLEQVLVNLCLNARDAMPEGGRLEIASDRVDIDDDFVREHPWARAGRYVLVRVTDSGVGMTSEVIARIFEPFFTTKPEGVGSGLGLAVSRGIVEQHGGFLHAESAVGAGATFSMYLPEGEDRVADTAAPAPRARPRGDERVLLADDQEHVRRVVQRVLERAGYAITAVPNGAAAVDAVASVPFDLVILDAVMPVMGGREAFERIRALKPELPILFVSGYGAEELTARFLEDTRAPLLPKPFEVDALLRTVRELLDVTA